MSAVLLALAGLPMSAGAQTPSPTFLLSVTEPYELIEEVGTTRRITRADIEVRNARTLDEALRLLPGVYVRTGCDGTPRIDLRGFRSRHVLLLVNGVPVNSTADGQFDPARISTATIREIKVSYGSSSVLYGDNAMAGVVPLSRGRDHGSEHTDSAPGRARSLQLPRFREHRVRRDAAPFRRGRVIAAASNGRGHRPPVRRCAVRCLGPVRS
jgi:outer membrane cobalamin receptor